MKSFTMKFSDDVDNIGYKCIDKVKNQTSSSGNNKMIERRK